MVIVADRAGIPIQVGLGLIVNLNNEMRDLFVE